VTKSLLSEQDKDALTLALVMGHPGATPDDAATLAAWASGIAWQYQCLRAILDGRCGVKVVDGGVDLVDITASDILT